MTRREILTMADGLKKARLTGPHFTYAVKTNKLAVYPKAKSIRESIAPAKEHTKYLNAQEALNASMARKDPSGAAVKFRVQGGMMYDLPGLGDPSSEYEKATAKLKEEHKQAIESHEKAQKENEKFLDEDDSVNLMMINIKMVPKDVPQDVMDGLFYMIKKVEQKDFD